MGAFIAYFKRTEPEPPIVLDYLKKICDKLDSIEDGIGQIENAIGNCANDSCPDFDIEKILLILERWELRTRASPSVPCPGQKESDQVPFSERVLSEIDHSASDGAKP